MNNSKTSLIKRPLFIRMGSSITSFFRANMLRTQTIIFVVFLILVVGTWTATPFVVDHFYQTMPDRGQFGDLFGCVNALFSGLAFAGLIWTIMLQRHDIIMQHKEQGEQSVALQKQLKIMHQSTYLSALPEMILYWQKELVSTGLITDLSDRPSLADLKEARQTLSKIDRVTHGAKVQEAENIIGMILKARHDLLKLYGEIDREINTY